VPDDCQTGNARSVRRDDVLAARIEQKMQAIAVDGHIQHRRADVHRYGDARHVSKR
jgi:hypothetical protein